MPSLIERIRAQILQIGRGADEQIEIILQGDQGTLNPGFRRKPFTNDMQMKSGGRSTWRHIEKSTLAISADQVLNDQFHNRVLLVNSTAAARLITLPPPENGLVYHVVDALGTAATNNITIARNAAEKIDNVAASLVINRNHQRVTLISNGTDWFSIAKVGEAPQSSGTVNAAFTTAGGSATINPSVRTITWHRIGQVVFLGGRLDAQSISAPTGAFNITGLPFPALVDSHISLGFVVGRSFNSLAQNPYGKILAGASQITVEDFKDGDAANFGNLSFGNMSFILGGSYITSAS